jgi:hypothetical protein
MLDESLARHVLVSGRTHPRKIVMGISSISAASAAPARRPAQAPATTQAAEKPRHEHHQHHHAGGAKGTGALTAGKLTPGLNAVV